MKLFAAALLLSSIAFAQVGGSSTVNLGRLFPTIPSLAPPVMHVDTLSLANVATGTASVSMTLTAVPTPAMGAVVYFASSQVGGDVFTAIPAVTQSINFTLPVYCSTPNATPCPAGSVLPFTASDIISVVYWSTK